jgi:cob(I)alamin adenosyltransferase
MKRITRVTTGKGDRGQTRLAGGQRVEKDSLKVNVYGTIDELNSHIGLALALGPAADLVDPLRSVQNDLFHLGAELSAPPAPAGQPSGPRIEARHIAALEAWNAAWVAELGPLREFILPGGTQAAAALHVARTVCRRAERLAVGLSKVEAVSAEALQYLNRLSDTLFLMARLENKRRGQPESFWDMRA